MANRLSTRVKKIEDEKKISETFVPVTKIVRKVISPDGTISSLMAKELIDGVWMKQKNL